MGDKWFRGKEGLPARHRRGDADFILVQHLGLEPIEKTNVLPIYMHEDETAHFARLVENTFLHSRKRGFEVREHFADRLAGGGNLREIIGQFTQGCWN